VAAIYDDLEPIMSFKSETMYTRMRTMVGNLISLDLDNKEAVRRNFLQLQKENYPPKTV